MLVQCFELQLRLVSLVSTLFIQIFLCTVFRFQVYLNVGMILHGILHHASPYDMMMILGRLKILTLKVRITIFVMTMGPIQMKNG